MLQHIRSLFVRQLERSVERAQPGYQQYYQTNRVPEYSLISVYGDIDGDHGSIIKRYTRMT